MIGQVLRSAIRNLLLPRERIARLLVERSPELTESDREFLEHQRFGKPSSTRQSAAVVTFHKCASSFFSASVLGHCRDLTHIDYESRVYHAAHIDRFVFRDRGYVYGSLRLVPDDARPDSRNAAAAFLFDAAARGIRTVFVVRDPRDLIVSMYYSFGFTHNFSDDPTIRQEQQKRRDRIQAMGLDNFALERMDGISTRFRLLHDLEVQTPERLVLRYEDMIHHFDHFYSQLSEFLDLDPQFRQQFFEQTRPRVEEVLEHRRSGHTEQFRTKLAPSTIATLNQAFAGILERHGYPR